MGLYEVFRAGGWPMYPILILGIFLIVATARHAKRPEQHQLPRLQNLRFVTMLTGFLGTTLGMIHCLMGLSGLPPNQPYGNYALLGLGESLNCIGFALIMILTAALITTVRSLRTASGD